jgi:hypothetical protein
MGRLDQQLAMYEFLGGYSTRLADTASQGSQTISIVSNVTGSCMLDVGHLNEVVFISEITGTGPYTATLKKPLQYSHENGVPLAPFKSKTSSVFPFLQSLMMGEPLNAQDNIQPILFILAPKAKEYREYAQKKLINYTMSFVLVHVFSSLSKGDEGSIAIQTFYNWMDQISAHIRTNKTLVTASYPTGAAIKFGENFTTSETHERIENSIWLVAKYDVESIEQVNA